MTGVAEARRVRLPYPHAGQQAVLKSAKRFNWLVAGRRWYKTSLASQICIEHALQGERIMWGAPTYDQVRIAYDFIERITYSVGRANSTRMEMKFPSGGSVLFRSLDNPDNARGHTAHGVIMDEVADLPPAAWSEVLRPMLITTKGWAWGIGTPKGRNWLWAEVQNARDAADSAVWSAPTVGCEVMDGQLIRKPHPLENTTIDFAEIEALWRTLPERAFRQEIMAEFTEDNGSVFREVRRVSTLSPTGEFMEGHRYVMGLDWGRSNDFTVVSVIDTTTHCQVALDRFNQIGWEVQRGRVKALVEKWKPSVIIAEENSIGGPNIEALQAEGIAVHPFFTSQSSKDEIINTLSLAIEMQRIELLNDPIQIAELEAYELQRSSSGLYRYSAPPGGHDDTIIALALALYGTQHHGALISFVESKGVATRSLERDHLRDYLLSAHGEPKA